MSVKFIITGDIHFRGNNPRARLDDYMTAIKRKLNEVFTLALNHDVEAVICPGDLFDTPGAMWGTVAELANILRAKRGCPMMCIHGNHDIWAGNAGSKYRTPYGFLAQMGIITDICEEPFSINDSNTTQAIISGHGFNVETDTPLGLKQFMPPEIYSNNICNIHVVHSMLMERPPGFEMRHTLISDVMTTADVIISGHEHIGFGIKWRDDGTLFINPGALCRLSAHPAEIERTVRVALLEIENGKVINARLIPLKSALPGHEVLSREHLEYTAERADRLGIFLDLLASEGESKFLEVREIVEDIAARDNLPDNVKKEALRRIGLAREALGARGGAA